MTHFRHLSYAACLLLLLFVVVSCAGVLGCQERRARGHWEEALVRVERPIVAVTRGHDHESDRFFAGTYVCTEVLYVFM